MMSQPSEKTEAEALAAAIEAEIRSLPVRNTPSIRAVRRKYARLLREEPARLIMHLARILCKKEEYKWIAYELILGHQEAFKLVGESELEELGQGINSWWTVDAFARTLAGPAWLRRQVRDDFIVIWAGSSDRWWRRAALVSTVALNMRSQGGQGDVPRTLDICRLLAGDHDDMVAKALSWALRELVVHDARAVKMFLKENDQVLAALVKREVRNKLETGLKSPGRKKQKTRNKMKNDDEYNLTRFLKAQEMIFASVLEELKSGLKRSHWMWFIFPQIEGLGHSPTSLYFSIKSLEEARAYLNHPVLGARLAECGEILLAIEGKTAAEIFAFPDDLKLRSSMTLFACAAGEDSLFARVLVKFFNGEKDKRTLELVGDHTNDQSKTMRSNS